MDISSIGPGGISGIGGIGGGSPLPQEAPVAAPDGGGFGELLSGLSGIENDAANAVSDLAIDGNQDLHEIVLATEMESIGFELAVQIRNRLVDAYQEIFRMSV